MAPPAHVANSMKAPRERGPWLEGTLYRGAVFLLTNAVVGVVSGVVGILHWAWVVPTALVVTGFVTTRVPVRGVSVGPVPVALLTLVVGFSVGLSLLQPGEHLLTGRDPATYSATAGWLAETGRFQVDARVGPFSDEELEFAVPGFYDERPDGRLSPEFFHAFPALIAVVQQIGGLPAMLGLNAVIGGLALVAVFALAFRLAGQWWAIVAVLLVGLNQVFVYFSRAPFSEPLALLFVAAGSWMLIAAADDDTTARLLGGMVLGASVLARVDGLLLVIPLVALVVAGGSLGRWAAPVLRGFLWMAAFGIVEVLVVAPWYLGKFDSQFLLIGVAVAVLLAYRLIPAHLRTRFQGWFRDNRAAVGAVLLGVGAAALVFGYAVRPLLGAVTGVTYDLAPIQAAEGLAVEPDRTYAEFSLHWLNWYLGPTALILGLVGLGILSWRAITGRLHPPVMLWVGITVMVSGAYLWRPSINPDHIWAMRRFLPVVIPGLAVAAAVALHTLAKGSLWRTYLAGALAAVAVGGVAMGYADVWDLHELEGLNEDFEVACETLGSDAAVLVVDSDTVAPSSQLLQSFRSYCGVPAAGTSITAIDSSEVASLAGDWAGEGRRLVVVAGSDETLESLGVEADGRILEGPYPFLEYTLTRRPTDITATSAAVSYGFAR